MIDGRSESWGLWTMCLQDSNLPVVYKIYSHILNWQKSSSIELSQNSIVKKCECFVENDLFHRQAKVGQGWWKLLLDWKLDPSSPRQPPEVGEEPVVQAGESLETDSGLGEKWCLETWKGIYMVASHASMHRIRRMWFEYLYVAAQLMSVSAPHHIALPLTLSGMAHSFLVLIAFFHETSAKMWWMAWTWPCSFCSCDYLCDIYCNEYHINQRSWTMIRWCLVHLET